jgi:glycosyltransferase involved in cell wall biosynthesis
MAQPLRVVFLAHSSRFSGAEIKMMRLIKFADEMEATVILAEDGPFVEALHKAGARVEIMPLAERARGLKRNEVRAGLNQALAATDVARYIRRLRARLVQLQPDIVDAISLKAGTYGALAARLASVPMVWHVQDQVTSSYLSRQAVLPVRALISTLPSAVITPSKATMQALGRLRRGMHAAVIPELIPLPPQPVSIRAEVGRIGIVGRLAPWKGQDVFLEAFAKAYPETGPTAVVIGSAIFGEDDFAGELPALAERLGIGDRVEFRGFREDVNAELESLDLLVHASVLTEPGGTVVLEGMAAGLPVIAAGAGGPGEHISHGSSGLLHPPGDVGSLAAMLRLAADDYELRARLGVAARRKAREFSPEAVLGATLALYGQVLGRPLVSTAAETARSAV